MFRLLKRKNRESINDVIKFIDNNSDTTYLVSIIRKDKVLNRRFTDLEISKMSFFYPIFKLKENDNFKYAIAISFNSSSYRNSFNRFLKSNLFNISIHIKKQNNTYLIPCENSMVLRDHIKYLLVNIFEYPPKMKYIIQKLEVKRRDGK